MRDKGKLVTWNDDKGYGFIAPFSGTPRDHHLRILLAAWRDDSLDEIASVSCQPLLKLL